VQFYTITPPSAIYHYFLNPLQRIAVFVGTVISVNSITFMNMHSECGVPELWKGATLCVLPDSRIIWTRECVCACAHARARV